jgi:integrase
LGLQIKQVQERMGHSGIQITMNTYGHLFPIANEADVLARAEGQLRDRNATSAGDAARKDM